MWRYNYDLVTQIQAERQQEAERARLAAHVLHAERSPLVLRLRRVGARSAADIARALDACVARETLAQPGEERGRAA